MEISALHRKIVGVWGYGVVGKSTVAYLRKQGIDTIVCQAGALSSQAAQELATLNVQVFDQNEQLLTFLATCDYIIPSGGIDLRPYNAFAHKWLPELDLFQLIINKIREQGQCASVIAITGSVGKTTVTHTLYQLLQLVGSRVLLGGNIGVGLCDLIDGLAQAKYVVIEVSSFQLEHCRIFAPDVAVITNLYENHLDRHGTMVQYAAAKFKITTMQRPGGIFVCDWSLVERGCFPATTQVDLQRYYCTIKQPHSSKISSLKEGDALMTIKDNQLVTFDILMGIKQLDCSLPEHGFKHNWLLLATILHALGIDPNFVTAELEPSEILAHRLSTVATINDITYIDDSKATIMDSTLAAVNALQPRPIILLLGGLSKGIDRSAYFSRLTHSVKAVVTFGAEREQLATGLMRYNIPTFQAEDMTTALTLANAQAVAGDVVLLSPGGSSFDLYANYKERGKDFARYVHSLNR